MHQALQNRVDPFGLLHAIAARGTMMGNRGGRFHRPDRSLRTRRFASKRWICCVCDFRGRQRDVWGDSYTELFFLDEVTALAAGHRPCFECRRSDAKDFAARFHDDGQSPSRADIMDAIAHRERLAGWRGYYPTLTAYELPDGAMFARGDQAFAIKDKRALRWTSSGYADDQALDASLVRVLTPPAIVQTLHNGYQPRWHCSTAR